MGAAKPKSIEKLERKMEEISPSSVRYAVLESAKNFKASWIKLGRKLYTVWKDKLYKEWGYTEFDTYASKEIGIRKQTALKLLRSYAFLEKEEPRYLASEYNKEAEAREVPTYESVDLLRRASTDKNLDSADYMSIRKSVLEKGKDIQEVKKDLAGMKQQARELMPEVERRKKRVVAINRLINLLRSTRNEIKTEGMLPDKLVRDIDRLVMELESHTPGM